jgi:hypothetical protein
MSDHGRAPASTWPLGFVAATSYVGAAVYFVSQSNGAFWNVILALLEASVWPAFVVFHVLQILHV